MYIHLMVVVARREEDHEVVTLPTRGESADNRFLSCYQIRLVVVQVL